MSDHSGLDLSVIFDSALEEYEKETGKRLAEHPLAERLDHCGHSLESVSTVLQEQAGAFNKVINSKITKSLKFIVPILHTLSTAPAIRNAISAHFPPAPLMFTALAILLDAAKGVHSNHDELANLLELIGQFLNRLEIFTQVPLTGAVIESIVRMMVQLLHVLGLVTKAIKRNYLIKVGKKLLGENDIEVALQKLNKLTLVEGQTIAVQTFKDVREVKNDGKVGLELLQQMASDVNKSKRDKLAQDIQSWLSPPDPWKNQNEINKKRHTGTAAWFLNGEKFSEWKLSEQSYLLWIKGKPGAGKSVLCSTIIQDIITMQESCPAALMFFYCDFKEEQKRSLRGLLSSLLVQLCHQSDSYHDLLSNFFLAHKSGSQHASDAALVRCLKDIMKLPRRHPVYLIVDALDEYPNPPVQLPPREELLNFLEDLFDSNIPNLRICVTSRPESDITDILDRLTHHPISLHDERQQIDDISGYIRWFVDNDKGMRRWTTEEKQYVINFLTRKADGMFQWVACQLPYLRKCPSSEIQRVLEGLPETLPGTYERILREIIITKTHKEIAHRLFQCIAVASRPFRVEELADIFAFDFSAHPIPKFREDWRQADPMDAVLSACSSLLTVVEDTQVIQFSHLSVKEFLTSDHLSKANDPISYFYISMTSAHTLVTQVCLGILSHLPKDVTRDSLKIFHLVEYAAKHWVDHARFKDVSQHVEDGMKCLFDPSKSHLQVWVWIHDPEVPSWRRREQTNITLPLRGTPLHYAVLCGFHSIVESLITEHSQGVDSLGFDSNETPLHLASSRGYIEVAQVLLKHSAIATSQNRSGRTPLHEASFRGHVEVARLLIEHGAVATTQDEDGWTSLHWASSRGHVEVARLLIERGAVATAQNKSGSTPLHEASFEGHVEVARLLIERGADATAQNKRGWTPLHQASSRGDAEVARLLIEHGAVTTAQDKSGSTPLHKASSGGHVEVARLLIKHSAVATAQDESGSTPLHEASSRGHVEVARLLIQHGAVATTQDESESTPLLHALSSGHVEVARLLIEHSAVVTAQDKSGWVPLLEASSRGHVEVARLLIEHCALATAQDENGSTPLHWASSSGHVEVARLLIEHGAVTTAQDGSGSTPLHEASSEGHAEVARLLIGHGAVATAQDKTGWTPLHKASSSGQVKVARLLIKHGAVATAQDENGSTPLHEASYSGHVKVARLLIGHGAVVTAQDGSGSTPLHQASSEGHLEVSRLLIEHDAVATAQDKSGSTPLHEASSEGHVEVSRLLIEHGAVATTQDGSGLTPLHQASSYGQVEVARLLIERGAVMTAQDESGWTPLHHASSEGQVEVARLLIEQGAVATAQDKSGSTPLHRASSGGHVELAELLLEHSAVAAAEDRSGLRTQGGDRQTLPH